MTQTAEALAQEENIAWENTHIDISQSSRKEIQTRIEMTMALEHTWHQMTRTIINLDNAKKV